MGDSLGIIDAGLMRYSCALELQRSLVARKKDGDESDYLILVEHTPVITLGRRACESHLLMPREEMARRGVDVFDIERGGDVTYHCPGQLVGYPIVDLKRAGLGVGAWLRFIEAALVEALVPFGVAGFARKGLTGVWTHEGKLAAIGVAVTRWISFHGFALNVNADLSGFDLIVPCGLASERVTSMSRILGKPVDMGSVKSEIARVFSRRLGESLAQSRDTAPAKV
jgi:lipoate-protein ligase B